MEKVKHSKYRNTGLIFEILTRQITVDVLNNKDRSPAIGILKEHFGKERELTKELNLYQATMKECFAQEQEAKDFISEVVSARAELDSEKLRNQKYELVGAIKNKYPLKEFFKTRVNNYTEMASLYKLFKANEDANSYDPADVVRSKYTLVEHVTEENERDLHSVIKEQKEESRDLRILAQRIMTEKFNEKYGDLLPEQKNLLRKYINNISNTNGLREFINEEVDKIVSNLKERLEEIDNKVIRIKITEAINLAEDLKKGSVVYDNQVSNLLMYYQLNEEIKGAVKDE
jgi:hypothetical protein